MECRQGELVVFKTCCMHSRSASKAEDNLLRQNPQGGRQVQHACNSCVRNTAGEQGCGVRNAEAERAQQANQQPKPNKGETQKLAV
jgi:hypothetical protein